MKSLTKFNLKYSYLRDYSICSFLIGLILIFTSCTTNTLQPFSILEFNGEGNVINFSNSGILVIYEPDSVNPTALLGKTGDLFLINMEDAFIYNDTSPLNRFSVKYLDGALYINNRIYSVKIPKKDSISPWFEELKEKDLSSLQFIDFSVKLEENHFPYLAKIAEIKPDAGFIGEENFREFEKLLKIFKPRYIIGPELLPGDYEMLSGLNNLELLMMSLDNSVIYDPLPNMPGLKQLFLAEIDEAVVLKENFLINNKQIERVFIQKNGSFDFSVLKPLENLKELVVSGPDTILNLYLINDHKKIEVLSLVSDENSNELDYNPGLIRLPALRWMTFSSGITQEEFNSFINTHPDIEILQLIRNDTISSLQPLSTLSKLTGLTVTGSVTDIASIKTLKNLKYLSLPDDFLDDPVNKAEMQKSLPDTRIVSNVPFCLGSGWILLLIPLVLMIRFFGRKRIKDFRTG